MVVFCFWLAAGCCCFLQCFGISVDGLVLVGGLFFLGGFCAVGWVVALFFGAVGWVWVCVLGGFGHVFLLFSQRLPWLVVLWLSCWCSSLLVLLCCCSVVVVVVVFCGGALEGVFV